MWTEAVPGRKAALMLTTAQALARAILVAEEARQEWDVAPAGMRAGKILCALSGRLPGYRADIDEIHTALAAAVDANLRSP